MVRAAANRVHGLGYSPTIAVSDGREGLPAHAPYDRLIATFGVGRIPAAWCQQVRPGGLIVANVGLGIARLVVAKDDTAQGLFDTYPASFMTARDAPDVVSTTAQQLTAELTTAQGKDPHHPGPRASHRRHPAVPQCASSALHGELLLR